MIILPPIEPASEPTPTPGLSYGVPDQARLTAGSHGRRFDAGRHAKTRDLRPFRAVIALPAVLLLVIALATTDNSPAPDPSGVPVPTGNTPGWNLVYSQDFNGTSLPPGWHSYSGEPGGDPYGYWDNGNVTVSNGELHFLTTADSDPTRSNTSSTGGVNFYGNPQTYGMWLVRMKGDSEPSLKISDIALLWPAGNSSWPPEMDFFEDTGGTRSSFIATLHPGPNGDNCCTISKTVKNDATQWHTYGIKWTPTVIRYTIDGKQWGSRIFSSQLSSPAQWPSINMDLDLQSQNLGPAEPTSPVETMTVDWVAEYASSS